VKSAILNSHQVARLSFDVSTYNKKLVQQCYGTNHSTCLAQTDETTANKRLVVLYVNEY